MGTVTAEDGATLVEGLRQLACEGNRLIILGMAPLALMMKGIWCAERLEKG